MELTEIPRVVDEALAVQEIEIEDGFSTSNPALLRLTEDLSADDLRGLIHRLRSGAPKERQLGARLLKGGVLAPHDVLEEVHDTLRFEVDPAVIRWLVVALGESRSRLALSELVLLGEHPDAQVRFQVPSALSACADGVFSRVAESLLGLSRDSDDDVRWSAVYELAAWRSDSVDPRIRSRLAEVASSDPVVVIRTVAVDGLGEDIL